MCVTMDQAMAAHGMARHVRAILNAAERKESNDQSIDRQAYTLMAILLSWIHILQYLQ